MEPNWKSSAAGVINILAGLASLLTAFGLLVCTVFFSGGLGGFWGIEIDDMAQGVTFAFVLFVLGSLTLLAFVGAGVGIWGGIEALRRRSWAWAIAGSIVSFVVLFPVGPAAVVLVLMGEHEFAGRGPDPVLPSNDGPSVLPETAEAAA